MLRSGHSYLSALQDGRVVYAGSHRVDDVTSHSSLGATAETFAHLFDLRASPAHRPSLVISNDGAEDFPAYFLQASSRNDLNKRLACHQVIANATHGLLGRSPDHVASLITGLALGANELTGQSADVFAERIVDYYNDARSRDAFIAYAVVPQRPISRLPALRIVHHDRTGITISGTKVVATAAVFADEVWIGNLQPIEKTTDPDAITCVVPCNAEGLELRARPPFITTMMEARVSLSRRFDESDAVLFFDNVMVPWHKVFSHSDTQFASEIYVHTPAHSFANHQAAVRCASKLRVIASIAHAIVEETGMTEVALVRENLGRLAAFEATASAMVEAQVYAADSWSEGVAPNRRYVYAALDYCQETIPKAVALLGELCSSGIFSAPSYLHHLRARSATDEHSRVAAHSSERHVRLLAAAWDLVGSEFAGRHQQYEHFFAGPPSVVRAHCDRTAPWQEFEEVITRVLTEVDA